MTHLSDEQLEELLGGGPESPHLAECPACRQKLAERQAVRARLRTAFASVTAPAGLAERIRAQASVGEQPAQAVSRARPALLIRLRRYALPLAAAAAIVLVGVPLLVLLGRPGPAQAAQQELVNIHRDNLADGHGFHSQDEPAKLAQYFKDKLGFVPAMPRLNQGMAIRGCCIAHFREKIVGSYVVDTPHGKVSIIVVGDMPEAVGLSRQGDRAGPPVWTGRMPKAGCNMAAVRMGNYTYTAVSAIPQDSLIQLLDLLAQ